MATNATCASGSASFGGLGKQGYPCVSFSKAIEYMSRNHSCLSEIKSEKEIKLSPCYIGRISDGIRETLDVDLLKYSEEFDGIIFAYNQVQCLEVSGSINDEMPLIHFKVVLRYIVFKPQIGMTLKGVVNKVGHGHFGCLVHECFNASVRKPNETEVMSKRIKKLLNRLEIGSEFVFRITRLDIHNDILSIKGKLDDNESVDGETEKSDDTLNSTNSTKKTKTSKGKTKTEKSILESESTSLESSSTGKTKKKKKKSKNHEREYENSESVNDRIVNNIKKEIDSDEDIKKEIATNEDITKKSHSKKLKRRKSEAVIKFEQDDSFCNNNDNVVPKKKKRKSM